MEGARDAPGPGGYREGTEARARSAGHGLYSPARHVRAQGLQPFVDESTCLCFEGSDFSIYGQGLLFELTA